MAKNAVQKVEDEAKVPALASNLLDMVSADAGAGLNEMGADDFAIPRIGIIQSLSPQRNLQKPEFIEGCVEGQIFENVTKQLWKGGDGIVVIPVAYQPTYLEWKPRESGGGLVKNHGKDATLFQSTPANDKGKRITKDGNIIQRYGEYFVMVMNADGVPVRAVLSMTGTALKQAKAWNNMINQSLVVDAEGKPVLDKAGAKINAPIFFYSYLLKTVPVINQQGQWFRWDIVKNTNEAQVPQSVFDLAGGLPEIYEAAKSFRDAITSGAVKVADPVEEHGESAVESDEDPM